MIVGIGASAGGLEAFVQLLEALPADTGLALVIVQHLSPRQTSALPELLASHTRMPVVEVTSGVRVARNHVYVIPPNAQIELVGDRLMLAPRPTDRTQHTPIDTFFTSLASAAGARSIAAVLSGTASDGALGLRDVKAAGGITFAQAPDSAKQGGMPRAAIATGMVDLVLTPAEIGLELANIARHPFVPLPGAGDDRAPFNEQQLQPVFEMLRPASGVDFRHYKLPTIRRRLLRRMALHRIADLTTYIALLQSSPAELRALFEDLLIHVTRFFREPESFQALKTDVLPKLLDGRKQDQPLRVWVCGCATGEEAYSLAIVIAEHLQHADAGVRAQIFATDVSETAIDHARAGIYPASIAADVGPERLRRFFARLDGHYRISKAIRDMCVFARQDLTKDPPFSRIDLVLCRNVLIYMNADLQRKLMAVFHYALNTDGFLMLGQAETVGTQAGLFALVDKKHRIHRKKHTPPGTAAEPVFPGSHPAVPPHAGAVTDRVKAGSNLLGEINRFILDRYAPPGVVVDANLQIVQFRGQTGNFLEAAPGEASLNLLKMTREGLLYGLRSALQAAKRSRAAVRKTGLWVRTSDGWLPVVIEIVPLTAMGKPHYLVLFDSDPEARSAGRPAKKANRKRSAKDDDTAGALRRELAASREYLQSIIQELEAANEELQSANEEILSSNEELQSTNEELDTAKEELQSTNEELNTLNDELQSRNEEMGRVNSDLVNLVASVQIAIVIVSPDLRIRRFTPMAEKVLNLIPSDVDRLIGHINPNIDCPNLEQLITECMDTVTPIEREVQDRQGRWYSLRIRPYKSLDNRIDGAVLALFDVDILKKSEQLARLAEAHAEAVIMGAPVPMALVDNTLHVKLANEQFANRLGSTTANSRGRLLGDLAGAEWNLMDWLNQEHRAAGDVLPPVTIHPAGGREFVIHGHFVPAMSGGEPLILITVTDAPERRR